MDFLFNVVLLIRRILFPTHAEVVAVYRRFPLPKGIWGDIIWWGLALFLAGMALTIIWVF